MRTAATRRPTREQRQRALELAGIGGPRESTSGASVVCDAGRRPTGHLLELEALDLVRALLPRDAPADRRARLADLLRRMAACGLTAPESPVLLTVVDGRIAHPPAG